MTERNFKGQTLLCLKAQSLFEENKFYYCFADEGHFFWVHAPFLLEKIGVDQIKVSSELRKNFVTKEEYRAEKLKISTTRYSPKHLPG